jgi:hypothetical protein
MLKRLQLMPWERLSIAALIVAVVSLFGAVVTFMMLGLRSSDYIRHVQFARDMLEKQQFTTTHVLYQLLVIGQVGFLPESLKHISFKPAGIIAAVAFYVFAALVLYWLFRGVVNGPKSGVVAAALALALLIVTPFTLLTAAVPNLYFGYIEVNAIHSPTMVMIKPFALLGFAFAVSILNGETRLSVLSFITGIALTLLSLLAKPNFALVLLPAFLVVCGYRLLRGNNANLKTALIVLVLPMTVLLAIQYVLQYIYIVSEGSLVFAPLLSLQGRDTDIGSLAIKFVLSIAFPLVVYLLYLPKTLRDLPFNFSWLIFLAGAGQMYLFAESGDRARNGNFWWSAQIGLFILFVVAALFWLRNFAAGQRWRGWLCLGVFALHLISGLFSILVKFQTTRMNQLW